MLRRRPCSVEDLAEGLGLHRNEVLKYVEQLGAEDRLEATSTPRGRYYRAVP
jgi:predicted ArsR family transcriptional regulator